MFFVATSPLSEDGHINLSPKGYNTFRVLDSKTVAYLDLCGSGVETIAHVKENRRMVIMFCAFEGPPKIIRLYGKASVIAQHSNEYKRLIPIFPEFTGLRAIIKLDVTRVSGSCGFSVPLYKYEGERDQLEDWAKAKGKDWLTKYQEENNLFSIDNLGALDESDL
ncbi:Pyridoxamine 5'-phosphate oxidase [Thalassolituus maritimus]|uniref:Pyridoxamine 5'-phosphate oxidase n=2 Tax=Thalassolituus maritimus TaxID=484498 RepID=A0A1N7Q9G7_9GAMM|nr:Pyridoxamine 5'-phosphate oxidase [Thalassolituus maritimus]